MAHTGLFVAPVAGTPPVGMSPTDGRLALGALFQIPATGAGYLVGGGGYTPSASVMQLTVNQAVWGLPDATNSAAVFFSPTDATTLTFSAAPGTGGRIDLVVVKQNNIENGDADSRVNLSVVTGTASGSPVAPAVPTGAAKYLQVLINAGVTNIAAATITNVMQTTFAEPQLQAPTLAALQTTTGVLSQLGIVTSDTAAKNGTYLWNGSSWVMVAGDSGWQTPTLLNSWVNFGSGYATCQYRKMGGVVYIKGVVKSGTLTTNTVLFNLPAGYRPTEQQLLSTQANTTFATINILSTGDVSLASVGSNASLSLNFSFPADA